MADIIDSESEIEELQRNAALSAHRIDRIDRSAVSAEHCEDCGIEIPEKRRAAMPGCHLCAECQGIIELKRKQRGF